jgi:hypothetical protein
MCVSCNCGKPYENHGDSRNITMDQVERAAQAIGKTPQDVAANIRQAVTG